ncbi:MAG TPA: lmo0937 family membrane protein [Candidatus Angelobacter sp.]
MFLLIAVVLIILWLLGWLVFKIAGALIHLVIVVAVIMFILHLIRGTRRY